MMSSKLIAHKLGKKWRSKDVCQKNQVDFADLLLRKRILSGLKINGFTTPSLIQLETIPRGKVGEDLIVQAKSGTGKTLVFSLIALEVLRPKLFHPQVLILAPTIELATQICSVIQALGSCFRELTCCSFIGGRPIADDKEKAITCQIAVGTPGRVKQLIKYGSLPTNSIRLFVMDEADYLLQGNFKADIDDIFESLPYDKQVISTSATYPMMIRDSLSQYFMEPRIVRSIPSKPASLLGVVHYTKVVESNWMPYLEYKNKLVELEVMLAKINFCQCFIFCHRSVEDLCSDIKKWGFSASYLTGEKVQSDRLEIMEDFKHLKYRVLVATDIISRGIDVKGVDLIINFMLPPTVEKYLHRVGRAGRYGSRGVAVSIITEKQVSFLKKIETKFTFKSYKLPEPIPENLIHNPIFREYSIKGAITSEGVNVPKLGGEEWGNYLSRGMPYVTHCNAANLHGLHSAQNSLNNFVSFKQRYTPHFYHSGCYRSTPQIHHLRPSQQQYACCCSKCPSEQRYHQKCSENTSNIMSTFPFILPMPSARSFCMPPFPYKQRNEHEIDTRCTRHNTSSLCCTRSPACCHMSSGCHCHLHTACCHVCF